MKYPVAFDIEFRKNSFPGRFIAIEGIEGSGKTTQAKRLVKELNRRGLKAIYTREPTRTPIGRLTKKILYGKVKVPPIALQYLFSADRAVHVEEIEAHLKAGTIVVTDRYFWSSVAYGVSDLDGTTDFYLTVFSLLSFYHQFIVPDITFFLDIPTKEAVSRIEERKKEQEIYDDSKKLLSINKAYDMLVERFSEYFTVIKGKQPIEKVTEDLLSYITE